MKHAILIIAHKNFKHLLDLIYYFHDGPFFIYIHIDKKSSFSKEQIRILSEEKNVVFVIRKYRVNWGGFNILRVALLLLDKATKDNQADYFHLISGMDFPVKNVKSFLSFFEEHKGKEFLGYHTLPAQNWENGTLIRFEYYYPYDLFDDKTKKGHIQCSRIIDWQKKHKIKRSLQSYWGVLYGGSGWFSLSKLCIAFILKYSKKKSAFYRRLKYTFAPEETYFPSIVLNSPFAKNTINDNLRYIDWNYRNGNIPANLDEKDYTTLMKSTAFFARKFEYPVSQQLVYLLKKQFSLEQSEEEV
ncbi:glycosyl transferase [Bacteroidia bacterium]|nr:glycosyl transferase [Bacteroidia bacterium]